MTSSKPSKGYRIAKTVIDRALTEELNWVRVERKILQETSGDLRFFIEVPTFIGQFVTGVVSTPGATLHAPVNGIETWRLYGRDPDVIINSYKTLAHYYEKTMQAEHARHHIIVVLEVSRRFASDGDVNFTLSVKRQAMVGGRWFNVDDDGVLKGTTYGPDKSDTVLDYTPATWNALQSVITNMNNGIKRLQAIIGDPSNLQFALETGTLLRLGADTP